MSFQSIRIPLSNSSNLFFIGVIAAAATFVAFEGSLISLINVWKSHEEYSHGFLIPLVSVWLLWMNRDALLENLDRPVWSGPAILLLAIAANLLGVLAAVPILSQLAFVLALIGVVLSAGGFSFLRVSLFPIVFLIFAIPIPGFVQYAISSQLQLVSSQLGAFFIGLLGIPVYVDGNVIDLGFYKIEIVQACSGLRYLYPLFSLSVLAAYFFRAPLWQRMAVSLSAIPITIVMNSVRIGFVGVTVTYWGNQTAEGVLHFFEGWFIFLTCACLLALELFVLSKISGRSFFDSISIPRMAVKIAHYRAGKPNSKAQLSVSLFVLCISAAIGFYLSDRTEIIPDRSRFISFPEEIGTWRGHSFLLDPSMELVVRPDDYLLSDYKSPDGKIVNFYVAYYASQRKNDKPHSPSECIQATGWTITNFKRLSNSGSGINWPLNRVVIQKNATKQVVYYWFDERGRKVANEYLSKWYLHADAIRINRTDGALVRFVTQIQIGESESDADRRLQTFIRDAVPRLSGYLPSAITSPQSVSLRSKDQT